jgi:hypothetical protein
MEANICTYDKEVRRDLGTQQLWCLSQYYSFAFLFSGNHAKGFFVAIMVVALVVASLLIFLFAVWLRKRTRNGNQNFQLILFE